jgi:hypothetical protein
MHPWMDPVRETRLWPHASGEIYAAYDRLFDCRRHGWANVQSVHLNLPFADEDEFGRLLAAARLVLPLVPALAASSPVVEGRATGMLDTRLHYYRTNAERVRAMAGEVIPEPVFGIEPYRDRVLGALDRELGQVGAPPVLRGQEWTNARGAIARFDRMAIEIRLIDTQECALGDLAVAAAVGDLVRGLVEERWASHASQRDCPTAVLTSLLAAALREGPRTVVADRAFAEMFGAGSAGTITMGELWRASLEAAFSGPPELEEPLQVIFRRGTLAERILSALGSTFDRERARRVYGELCDCLAEGRSFVP